MMSELGFHKPTGSSNVGLTFIRPMPKGGGASGSQESEGSSIRGLSLEQADRLFPPRAIEESGSAPPVLGLELGHFVIEERIGRGGMGAVFRALDKRLGRVVALKVLTNEHSSDPEAVLRFQNEARAAARLDHENIARVHYIGEDHGLHFIAFEFVKGMNIRSLILERGQLSPIDAVNYTLQIAEALRHTQAADVVHRDIKPSNIIVSPGGRAKLVDLGLARHTNPDLSRELTTVGTALGTFDYIAPEQALDARKVDVRSDIYSLGCTLYHMLTGSPPYPTGTMFEKVMNHHRPVPPNPCEKNRAVSPQLGKIVQKMMAANPMDRYSGPDELINDLILVASAMGLKPMVPDAKIWQIPQREYLESRWKGIRTWGTVALILVVVVLADRLRTVVPTRPAEVQSAAPGEARPIVSNASSPEVVVSVPAVETDLGISTSLSATSPPPDIRKTPTLSRDFIVSPPDDVFTPDIPSFTNPNSSETLPPLVMPNISGGKTTVGGMLPLIDPTRPAAGESPATPQRQMTANETVKGAADQPVSPMEEADAPVPDGASLFYVVVPPSLEDPKSGQRVSRPTLAAACSLAKEGWTIELPLNASPVLLQETLHITGKKIQIQPSEHYRPGIDPRPVIRVDLSSQLSMGPSARSAEMLHLDRAAVTFLDIDVEVVVDPTKTADWSIVTLLNGSQFSAHGSTLTFINPGNSRAAIVSVPAVESGELAERMPERMQPRQNRIDLRDSLCRGQCDFAIQQNSIPLGISLQNSALALSGCLLRIDGSEAYYGDQELDENRYTELSLDRVTLVAARGLLNMTSGEDGSLPGIRLKMNQSVCSVFSDQQIRQPLIEISGHEDFDQLSNMVVFKGNYETCFVHLSGPFSLIESTYDQASGADRNLTPEQMGAHHLQIVDRELLQLTHPLRMGDWNRIQRSELELRPDVDNPALRSTSNLEDAGVDWTSRRLPAAMPRMSEKAILVK